MRSRRLARPMSEALAPDSGRVAVSGAALSLNSGSTRRREPGLMFSLAAAREAVEPSLSTTRLLFRRPLALLSLVPTELSMFIAGGVAGAIAKTTTAPLDRVRAAAAFWPPCRFSPCAAHLPAPLAGQDSVASFERQRAVRRRQGGRQRRPDLHVHGDRQDRGRPRVLARKRAAGENPWLRAALHRRLRGLTGCAPRSRCCACCRTARASCTGA